MTRTGEVQCTPIALIERYRNSNQPLIEYTIPPVLCRIHHLLRKIIGSIIGLVSDERLMYPTYLEKDQSETGVLNIYYRVLNLNHDPVRMFNISYTFKKIVSK